MPSPALLLALTVSALGASGVRLTPEDKASLQARFRTRCPAITHESSWAEQDWVFPAPDGSALVLLGCNVGAYNPSVLVLHRSPEGAFTPADLPWLTVETATRADDGVQHTTVTRVTTAPSRDQIVYPRFDPATGILRATSKARGLGDARTDVSWALAADTQTFTLLAWMTDRSTDGDFSPACAHPVQQEGPCPGHEAVLKEDPAAMAYERYR